LQGVDLEVGEGEVVGLLGPNGAGKTTLIKILLGLVMPSDGSVRVFGEDLFCARRRLMRKIGAVVEAPVFFEYLTAFENLSHLAALSGSVTDARVCEVLNLVGLSSVAHARVRTFSYGMKQRLGIAQALLPATRLLVLDEPTNGLDPHGIAGMRSLIRELASRQGITVLVSSHQLTEIEQVCTRVAILDRGRKILEKRVEDLQRETTWIQLRLRRNERADTALAGLDVVDRHDEPDMDTVRVFVRGDAAAIPALVRHLVDAGADVCEVQPHPVTLEEVFLRHTGREECDVRIDAFRA
jgi:ABC-2 type transport system ATP-binding protein